MTVYRKEGRGTRFLSARRLKSFRCFAIATISVTVLMFFSLVWKTAPVQSNSYNPAAPIQDTGSLHKESVVTTVPQDDVFQIPAAIKRQSTKRFYGNNSRLLVKMQPQKSSCTYRTAVYLYNRRIELNQSPFVENVKEMVCYGGGDIAIFDNKFARFNNFIIDPAQIRNIRKGGENMNEVWNQKEEDEYIKVAPGIFKAFCTERPKFNFSPSDHLNSWAQILQCYKSNLIRSTQLQIITGTTLAIQRYEYVNLYHTMTDFYNAFVLMLLFGIPPSKFNILAVDAHPEGSLDPVWSVLFGKFIRVGQLPKPTVFQNLIWGLLGYSSPLNDHSRSSVPYLDAFREFFLRQYNISTNHEIDCQKLNVLIIWRRDYVAHPRNQKGHVVRKFDNEDEIVQNVKQILGAGAKVQGLQLDAMPLKDQLEIVAKTDILMGMHGAGMSHILFLPATSGVIEFKPEFSNPSLLHFKCMALWRGLPYTIWQNFDLKNEKMLDKTYIPWTAIMTTVNEIHTQICKTMR